MPTSARPRSLVALATATIALTSPLMVNVAPGRSAVSADVTTSAIFDMRTHVGRSCAATPGYGWPVKPFHRPHAVRGSFGDPRVGLAPSGVGLTYTFHNGVDVVAEDGTPVYATLTGSVFVDPKHPFTVWVGDGRGTMFGYWHVVPAVRPGEHVTAYETIVGHVQRPWGHVHFTDSRDGTLLNPLRPMAMGPYVDRTPPDVASLTLEHDARPISLDAAHGSLDIIAQVDDPPANPIAPPWDGLPIMPAEVRWRIIGPHGAGTRWATALDIRTTIPNDASYGLVYAQWTRQNHPAQAGRYRVYLSHGLRTNELPNGLYRVDIAASDVCGNRTTASASLTVQNGAPL